MSKVDERYKRGKIYCLRSHHTDMVYIGSTIQGLAERKGGHKSNYKKWLKRTFPYTTSFEIIKYDDAYIELVENYPCESKSELERREGEIMRETENCCNRYIAGRTIAEYRTDNKDKKAIYNSEYYAKNKDKFAERMVEYYVKNKDKIAEKAKEKVQCECGSEIRKSDLVRHKKSKKHQKWLEQQAV